MPLAHYFAAGLPLLGLVLVPPLGDVMASTTVESMQQVLVSIGCGVDICTQDYLTAIIASERKALARRIKEAGDNLVDESRALSELTPIAQRIVTLWGTYLHSAPDRVEANLAILTKGVLGRTAAAGRLGPFLIMPGFVAKLGVAATSGGAALPCIVPSAMPMFGAGGPPLQLNADDDDLVSEVGSVADDGYGAPAVDPPTVVIDDAAAGTAVGAADDDDAEPITWYDKALRSCDRLMSSTPTFVSVLAMTFTTLGMSESIPTRAASTLVLCLATWRRVVRATAAAMHTMVATSIVVGTFAWHLGTEPLGPGRRFDPRVGSALPAPAAPLAAA